MMPAIRFAKVSPPILSSAFGEPILWDSPAARIIPKIITLILSLFNAEVAKFLKYFLGALCVNKDRAQIAFSDDILYSTIRINFALARKIF
jgi:hypothetical protein